MRRSRTVLAMVTGALLLLGGLIALLLQPGDEPAPVRTAPAAEAHPGQGRLEASPRAFARPAALSPSFVHEEKEASFGAFHGRVVSATSGEGIASAELTFESGGVAFSTTTGGDGAFTFVPRSPGVFRLAVITAHGFHPFGPEWGHSPVALSVAAGRRVDGLIFQLEPRRALDGVVLAPDGGAISNAEVQVIFGGAEAVAANESARSTEAGRFTLAAPLGSVLEARHPSFSPARAVVGERHLLGERLRLVLGAPGAAPQVGSLRGRVMDAEGRPAPGALITASLRRSFRERADEPEPAPARAVADADGAFAIEGLREGVYQLQGYLEGVGRGGIPRVRTSPASFDLRLHPGATLRGVVRGEGGAPVAAFTVSLLRKRGALARDAYLTSAVVNAEGRFELEALPRGSYALQVAAWGHAVSGEVAVEVPDAGATLPPVEIQLGRGGRVFGVIRDHATRRPVAGAVVSMEGGVETAASSFPTSASTTTDANGAFSLSGLAEGLRSITVLSRHHHGRVLSGLAMREGGDLGPVEVTLTPLEPGEEPRMELVGIGAVLTPQRDVLRIGRVLPGGGAAEAGLREGDLLTTVDGLRVGELGFDGSVNRIRGPEGSSVVLGVRREGEAARDVVVYRRRMIN